MWRIACNGTLDIERFGEQAKTRCAHQANTRQQLFTFSQYSLRCTRKSSRLSLTWINDNLISPDVPALMVTPPENPDSIRIELIGSATSRNLGRRQNQDRVKQVKNRRRLSSQERYFQVLVHRYPGTSSTPPSCRSFHTPSSLLRTHPNGKRFQLLVLVRA